MNVAAKKICDDVRRRVRYRKENGDEWQTPEKTLKTGRGDCEDFAILVWSLCRKARIKCSPWVFYCPTAGHAVAVGDGWYASNGRYCDSKNVAASVKNDLKWKTCRGWPISAATLTKKGIKV